MMDHATVGTEQPTASRLLCGHIQQRPVAAILDDAEIADAIRIMREGNVGFLPVLEAMTRAVVGVVTDRDLITRAACAPGVRIADVMTRDAVAVRPDEPVTRALHLMKRHRITRVVVVDSERRPLGVLSLSDIAQYAKPSRIGRTLRVIAERKYGPERP